ncbi:MAG TPA: hypothetical protein VER55_09775, partial [Ardenticatenaceae bacterium]|nr:hypothetical protein [Ardenticatenaceae bacterium]
MAAMAHVESSPRRLAGLAGLAGWQADVPGEDMRKRQRRRELARQCRLSRPRRANDINSPL